MNYEVLFTYGKNRWREGVKNKSQTEWVSRERESETEKIKNTKWICEVNLFM